MIGRERELLEVKVFLSIYVALSPKQINHKKYLLCSLFHIFDKIYTIFNNRFQYLPTDNLNTMI